MTDRVVQYPSRYKLTPVSGAEDTYDLEAVPGTVTAAGTPLNKATFLSDATVAALESALGISLPGDPTPDDVFDAIAITPVRFATGSYTGTGTYGSSHPSSVTGLSFTPQLMVAAMPDGAGKSVMGIFVRPSTIGAVFYLETSGSQSTMYDANTVTWSSSGISWYSTVHQTRQLNSSGVTTSYIIFG